MHSFTLVLSVIKMCSFFSISIWEFHAMPVRGIISDPDYNTVGGYLGIINGRGNP